VLDYQVESASTRPRFSPNLLLFVVELGYGETWRTDIRVTLGGEPKGRYFVSQVGGPTGEPRHGRSTSWVSAADSAAETFSEIERWLAGLSRLQTANGTVQRAYDTALADLAALRLQKIDSEWYPAAGVPWYNCVFGRDGLITALQTLPIGCPFPRAVLTRLADLQGSVVNDWNDEEPGKIPHELRQGELSLTGKVPFDPFYGSVDTTLLYVLLVAEAYQFTGERQLLEEFITPVEKCLRWAAEYGDIDGDGFIEYWKRGPSDFQNKAWKDASDAVVDPEGRIVPVPLAIVEVQSLYYAALCRAAEIFRVLGDAAKADAAERRAEELYRRFNEVYWLSEEGTYAYCLDPAKRPIRTIASNPGQLLWTKIVPPERARLVANRLMADDMFCGWGIRTLSSQNSAFAPALYQRGSVWPHDNAIIALGMKRYGAWQQVNRIAEGIFAASAYFAGNHLPELWVGLDRSQTSWPVLYPLANVPQAWAAGSVPLLLRAILGIEPDVDGRVLYLTLTLPDWLDDITFLGLRCAGGTVDVRFVGRGEESEAIVLRTTGGLSVEQTSG
jgi:glycogen debranching enzyme